MFNLSEGGQLGDELWFIWSTNLTLAGGPDMEKQKFKHNDESLTLEFSTAIFGQLCCICEFKLTHVVCLILGSY